MKLSRALRLLLYTAMMTAILTGCWRFRHTPPIDKGIALRGVNLGNALEAPREGEWGLTLQKEYFKLIAEAGFDMVRIPIRWSAHANNQPPYTIEEPFFARVDWAVEEALANDLVVIINVHHYDALMNSPLEQRERFLALWQQIAEHYAGYDARLYFELLNEPHGDLSAALWNRYLTEAITLVRESNPDRTIVVGPAGWNSVDQLDSLQLPDDEHLLATFHYYAPFDFTHQGAEWVDGSESWLDTIWSGSERQQGAIRRDLDRAVEWGDEHGYPLLLGEFGAYSKADMASRVRWTSYVARQAERRGISWCYWEFGAGFGLYDPERKQWRQDLLDSLIPEE